MIVCQKCILNENYPEISFDDKEVCSLCNTKKTFKPIGENKLIELFDRARDSNSKYDALVPLSGGKDSTYILHLAVNVYKLNVLTMTYDNGFLSKTAIQNIKNAVSKTGVEHIVCEPDFNLLKRIYKNALIYSGDICGACDIGTKANILDTAKEYKVPLILYGTSPLENDSFVPDSIQDIKRFKYIMKLAGNIDKNELKEFLIYPNLNYFTLSYYKKTGKFGKEIDPLFYIPNPTDKEMGDIIKKTMDWKDDKSKEYTKHFDCIAEPLTNYIRQKIYGYERHLCQYSNMIRRGEITRDRALELYNKDQVNSLPENY